MLLVFSRELIGIFVPENETEQMRFAVLALRIISSGYIFYGLSMVMTQAFNGAGDTKTPTWVFFFGFWLFQVPLAFVLHTYTSVGAAGIFMAVPIAETLMAIAIYILFRKGKWKLKSV
jgi:Na+-driven multidrug efflux pump